MIDPISDLCFFILSHHISTTMTKTIILKGPRRYAIQTQACVHKDKERSGTSYPFRQLLVASFVITLSSNCKIS